MFFSSPPLRASVGALGDCGLLGTDPNGLRGRPYDSTQAMISIKKYMPFSPNCVRWIAIPTYKTLSDGSLYSFAGLDALGTWWYGSPTYNAGNLIHGEEPGTDDSGWFTKAIIDVANAVVKYGIPVLAAALATTGVGLVGSVALLAWRNLAMGQSLTDAILNAQQEKLATTSTYALDAFNQGLAKAKTGLTNAALKAVASELPGGSDKPAEAFYQAVQLVRAQQTQDLTVAALGTKLSNDEMNRVRLALKWGAPLSDVMAGVRGKAGTSLLSATSNAASQFVAANVASPEKIKAATSDVTTLQKLTSGAPSGSPSPSGSGGGGGGGGGSGPGVGTVAVAAVGGFFAWKWWKRRHP